MSKASTIERSPAAAQGEVPSRVADCLAALAERRGIAVGAVRSRTLRLDWSGLGRLGRVLPAIVAFRDGSAMLLEAVSELDGTPVAVLADPRARGADPILIDRIRFEAAWTGTAIVARPARAADPRRRPFGWRAVVGAITQEPRLLRDLLAATAALGLLAVAPVVFVQLVVGRVIPSGTSHSLLVLSLALLVIVLVEMVLGGARALLVADLAARVQARLSIALFDRVLARPLEAIERTPPGETMARVAALGAVGAGLGGPLMTSLLDMAALLAVLPLMAYLAPVPTLVVVVLAGACLTGVLLACGPAARLAALALDAEARRSGLLVQTLCGIGAVKGLALGGDRRRQWDRLTAETGIAELRLARRLDVLQAFAPLAERVLVTGTLAVGIFVSAFSGRQAELAPLMAVYLLAQRLIAPLLPVAMLVRAYAEARAAMAALGQLTADPPEPDRAGTGAPMPAGAIAFEGVRFRYPEARAPALRSVSFAVPAGTTLGIMGPSGAGKSTIPRLLQRLHAGHAGRISIDGTDVAEIGLERLRRAVVVVGASDAILSGTIRETITATRPDASFEDLSAAARAAGADEFIERLPRGYETHLHDGAPTLSAGQRQRLALARALVADPLVLVLDEALGALDAEIAASVEANLRIARRGRTTIVIAHNLASLVAADAILVMADGTVRDVGTHAELIERCPPYAAAWLREYGAREPDPPGGEGLLSLA